MEASYSPDDNKLRLYSGGRLPADVYARVRDAGFIYAPKQELFVAPMWTPSREDLLLELCGEVGDEDKSLVDRAAERAERFEDYSESRATDAARAKDSVAAIADGIPFGQPILVGHHSERRARKDAEKIQNGMARAVKMWDTAKYWERRAAGAIAHAKYKELPAVRARRIKKIEADKRKQERNKAEADHALKFWRGEIKVRKGDEPAELLAITEENKERICNILGRSSGLSLNCAPSPHGGHYSAWDVLRSDEERYKTCPAWTVAQCQAAAFEVYPRHIEYYTRWIAHYENRIAYERAMLSESGGLVANKVAIGVGGQVRRRGQWFVVTKVNMRNGELSSVGVIGHFASTIGADEIQEYKAPAPGDFEKVKAVTEKGPLCNYPGKQIVLGRFKWSREPEPPQDCVAITQAEWDAKHADYKTTRNIAATDTAGRHRVRFGGFGPMSKYVPVYITDAKLKNPPEPDGQPAGKPTLPARHHEEPRQLYKAPEKTEFDAMAESLKAGVKVVSAPQLFPTPPELAARMVREAGDLIGKRILEPSAGTGNLIRAIYEAGPKDSCEVVAVEINSALVGHLRENLAASVAGEYESKIDIRCADFMQCNGDLGKFDVVLMNPPFVDAQDVAHIRHAIKFLKPGGRLVAICANGPRQNKELLPIVAEYCGVFEILESGSFKSSGTMVNAALITLTAKG